MVSRVVESEGPRTRFSLIALWVGDWATGRRVQFVVVKVAPSPYAQFAILAAVIKCISAATCKKLSGLEGCG